MSVIKYMKPLTNKQKRYYFIIDNLTFFKVTIYPTKNEDMAVPKNAKVNIAPKFLKKCFYQNQKKIFNINRLKNNMVNN